MSLIDPDNRNSSELPVIGEHLKDAEVINPGKNLKKEKEKNKDGEVLQNTFYCEIQPEKTKENTCDEEFKLPW